LTIVNAGESSSSWSVELLPLEARERTAAIGIATPLVRDFAAAGTSRIAVAPDDGQGAPRRLRVAGAAGLPTYLGADGRITGGTDLEVGSGGVLLLPHARSLAAAWVESPGDAVSGLWGTAAQPREFPVGDPGIVRLDGPSAGLAVNVAKPSVLHLRTEGSLIGVIRRPAGETENLIQLRAATLELYLAPARPRSGWRPATGAICAGAPRSCSRR
jgi:hypothetical protein